MPELLAYSKTSVTALIQQIEERSSLLVLSGYKVFAGELKPVYEFKHLTFQEYLAAQAVTNGYLPKQLQNESPSKLLHKFFDDSRWREVVSLAAVLAGRHAVEILRALMDACRKQFHTICSSPKRTQSGRRRNKMWDDDEEKLRVLHSHVVSCIVDEVALVPNVVREAVDLVFMQGDEVSAHTLVHESSGGRYFEIVADAVFDAFEENGLEFYNYSSGLTDLALLRTSTFSINEHVRYVADNINSNDRREVLLAAADAMHIAYTVSTKVDDDLAASIDGWVLSDISGMMALTADRLIRGADLPLNFMLAWSIAWGAPALDEGAPQVVTDLRTRLIDLWVNTSDDLVGGFFAWALWALPFVGQAQLPETVSEEALYTYLTHRWNATSERQDDHRRAAVTLCHFVGGPWSRDELARKAVDISTILHQPPHDFPVPFLKALGDAGVEVLEEFLNARHDAEINDDTS